MFTECKSCAHWFSQKCSRLQIVNISNFSLILLHTHIQIHTFIQDLSVLTVPAFGSMSCRNVSAGNHWWQHRQGYQVQTASRPCCHCNTNTRFSLVYQLAKYHVRQRRYFLSQMWLINLDWSPVSLPFIICHDDCRISQLFSYPCPGKNSDIQGLKSHAWIKLLAAILCLKSALLKVTSTHANTAKVKYIKVKI